MRSLPLMDFIFALSNGRASLEKCSLTLCSYTQRSITFEMNSLPLSTLIVCGSPRSFLMRFDVAAT